jgi:hypothetical protein
MDKKKQHNETVSFHISAQKEISILVLEPSHFSRNSTDVNYKHWLTFGFKTILNKNVRPGCFELRTTHHHVWSGGKSRWFKSCGRIQVAIHFTLSYATTTDHAIIKSCSTTKCSASILHKVESIEPFLVYIISQSSKNAENKHIPEPMRLVLALLFIIRGRNIWC